MSKAKAVEPQKLFGPITSIFFTVGIFFSAQFWAGALISPYLELVRKDGISSTDLLQSNAWLTFAFVLILEAITLWTIRKLLRVEFGSNFATLGLNKPRLLYLGYALLGFGAYIVLYIIGLIVVKALFPELDLEQKQEIGFSTSARGISLVPVFLSLVILPPITEEIVTRGFLFGGLRTKLSFIAAATITSTLFAAAHLGASSDGLLWVAAVDTFILSLVLCYLREKTGSLWPSIGVHMLKNSLAFIILFDIFQYFR